jgi:uncharacterized protein YraI
MRHLFLATAALCGGLTLPAIAEAASGFSTANVNMRSGPSTAYPAVTLIPVGVSLRINGCLADTPWCDVSFAGGRGWVAGRYVQALYQQRRVYVDPQYYRPLGIPTVTFNLDSYWDRNYRGRDFYRDRDRWARGPDWDRNDGNPIYRRPPPPPYDPRDDEDQGNWRQRPPPPGYDSNDLNDNGPPRPRYQQRGNDFGQPRYGNEPDQGNFGEDNNPPPRRRPQFQQQQQPQGQPQQGEPQQGQPPRGQPPRQQPQGEPPRQPQPQQPAPQQPQAQQPSPQTHAQQPAATGNGAPHPVRRNDGQVVLCPDGGTSCVGPHSSHN